MSPWIHDANPTSILQVNQTVEKFKVTVTMHGHSIIPNSLKEQLQADPTYLQQKIKEYFLDNNHHMTLVMSPDVSTIM